MGKGGTKFVGEAINVRSGRKKTTYTNKELKKNMEKYLETGQHPDLQRARQQASGVLVPLPDHDSHRPHVFLDISIDNKSVGRLVIELFEDVAPAAARHLYNRCLPGSSASLCHMQFHKLLPYYAAYAAKSACATFAGSEVPFNSRLQHNVRGAVSVSREGSEVAITLGKAMTMDETHQVVGRVHLGQHILELLDDVPRSPADTPLMHVKITNCGRTDASGRHEPLDEPLAKESAEAAAARLKQESADTRSAVMEALQQGMSNKRTAEEAGLGPSSSNPAAAAGTTATQAAATTEAGSYDAAGSSSSKPAAPAPAAPATAARPASNSTQQQGPTKRTKLLDSLLEDLDDGSPSGTDSSEADKQ